MSVIGVILVGLLAVTGMVLTAVDDDGAAPGTVWRGPLMLIAATFAAVMLGAVGS